MERKRSHASLSLFTMLVGLLSQSLVISVISTTVEDQKNYYTPDPHAGTPPSDSNKSPPSHGHGGSPPSHGGGNCGSSPPHHDPTPSTPSTPSNPPSGGYNGGSPPTTPVDPGTPTIPSSPPSPITGTCNYWRSHPAMIWGILGWWGTLGNAFGVTASSSVPGFSPGLSLPQALSNTRTDGLGALYREGTASFLNSLVNNKFPFTTNQVRDRFVASLNSNKAAAQQAQLFKMANEGRVVN